jgi:hypothetical protein
VQVLKGKRGCDTLELKHAVCKVLQDRLTRTPRQAERALKLDHNAPAGSNNLPLRKYQFAKRALRRRQAQAAQDLGVLAAEVRKHTSVPREQHKGFFVVSRATRTSGKRGQKPSHITLVATTRNLMNRFSKSAVAQLDGGYKYNLLGWPLTLLGCTNPAMELAPTAILMTSSTKAEHVEEALVGYAQAISKIQQVSPAKHFVMSDAAEEYRAPAKKAFSTPKTECVNLMCWFHMRQAMEDFVRKHALCSEKDALSQAIGRDCDMLHNSATSKEFQAKLNAIRKHWVEDGYAAATEYVDKNGKTHNVLTHFDFQWVSRCPEWHCAMMEHHRDPLPSTNNACEIEIRWSRNDAGNVPGSALECVQFMLDQVEFYSKRDWDPRAGRAVEKKQWTRARAVRELFGTDKMQEVSRGIFCCRGRATDLTDKTDENERETISKESSKGVQGWKSIGVRFEGRPDNPPPTGLVGSRSLHPLNQAFWAYPSAYP